MPTTLTTRPPPTPRLSSPMNVSTNPSDSELVRGSPGRPPKVIFLPDSRMLSARMAKSLAASPGVRGRLAGAVSATAARPAR